MPSAGWCRLIPRAAHAVVVGAGTMGARIACVLADAGTVVDLLDVDEGTAAEGLDRARRSAPSPLLDEAHHTGIHTAGLERLEGALRGTSWVIEAIVEDPQIKRDLLARIDGALAAEPMPVVSTNTSALSVRVLAEDRSERFRRSFLGAHFFNPPRQMRLLELIPSPWLDESRMRWVADVASRRLGKGIVIANDTPGFIANRLGTRSVAAAASAVLEADLTVEEADILTGPLIGRPNGIFRLFDRIGFDVVLRVADDISARVPDDDDCRAPALSSLLQSMVDKGICGDKTAGGFYRRSGSSEREVWDLHSLSYRPLAPPDALRSSLQPLLKVPFPERLSRLATANGAARLAWSVIEGDVAYAAQVGPDICANVLEADRAMRWGWGWTLGPFQMSDAVSGPVAPTGETRYYDLDPASPKAYSFDRHESAPFTPLIGEMHRPADPGLPSGDSVSAHDLGGGVLGIELHGRLNLIDPPAIDTITTALQVAAERFDAAVLFTDGPDFSAGADLRSLLVTAKESMTAVAESVRSFQALTTAIRGSAVPVVAAARGRVLGGGAELCLAAARIHALSETWMGLVEPAVGLLPAGGGLMTLARRIAASPIGDVDVDFLPVARRAVELVMRATPSQSAADARRRGLMQRGDTTSADPDRQLADAIAVAHSLTGSGYRPPARRPIRVLGRRGIGALEAVSWMAIEAGEMTEHDDLVAREVIRVICGGDVPFGSDVDEEYLLDLEREGFLRLLVTASTQERIRYTLETGKPLRN